MSSFGLDRLFQPTSVAVVGASDRAGSLGRSVMANLVGGGFAGRIAPVNPRRATVGGLKACSSLRDLAGPIDLAVVCTPPTAVPSVIEDAAAIHAGAALILTAGVSRGSGSQSEVILDIARHHGLRLIGPNSFGLLAPHAALNASFAAGPAAKGDLALISQSGAVAAALVGWGSRRALGFSAVVSLGDALDVDVADCLDHFAGDRRSRAILLYVEAITDAKKFMSAARAAARVKPVVVVKGGRHAAGARAAATHTGALAGADEVYEAAFRRAGLLRVLDLDQLFAAAEVLGRRQWDRGDRLAILTNGGGVGVLAVDRHLDMGGKLAALSTETLASLDKALPATWSRANPVDIIGDADAQRFSSAIEILLAAHEVDAIVALEAPTALAAAETTAKSVVAAVEASKSRAMPVKPVLASWLGAGPDIQKIFAEAKIPHFETESDAIAAFDYLTRHRRAQAALHATPTAAPFDQRPYVEAIQRMIRSALAEGRAWLDPVEAASLLKAFRIPMVESVEASTAGEAAVAARQLLLNAEAVALKIRSRLIVHKSDVGGVCLDLKTPAQVELAATDMLARVRLACPEVNDAGFLLQPMVRRGEARELIAGLSDDPTFGPVILFGRGGVGVEVYRDTALGLPPLDQPLAADLIDQTEVGRTLAAYRDVPAADRKAVESVLVALGEIASALPEVRSIDLNPLLADAGGVLAVDARIAIAGSDASRMVIRPYPLHWTRTLKTLAGDSYVARPLRAEDEVLIGRLLAAVEPDDLRMRFFAPVRHLEHGFLTRLVHLDYARAIAFVALAADGEAAGVVRLHCDADHKAGEFAILVRSDLKGRGVGWALMQLMLEWARSENIATVWGDVLKANVEMSAMCRELGFVAIAGGDDEATTFSVDIRALDMASAAEAAA
ncbi:bifunctional acetate--CoA ligase family protein/GNAT family N-acetyltransferase [Hansschlegelia zhihuaiae]|uniref:Bifunctional acyl-CoA synthetase/GNAT family N-acetyltransferase n=1 Tax=Hansschlegelia zhihuaiae TaxID=405005 RepID=A0A4Q0MI27_9HYPH|nr:bifunctional acetate--CoA ligase family protein/GNAT family N-acetyltransferase [Hansschlegelia zhihuaiae]RXF73188.1 bifunctional acyl-CoA synthetase/GNAT family N-acetyltransferase [Hansschlegelia zhihuaiae]